MIVSDFIELHLKEWECIYFIKVSEIVAIAYDQEENQTRIYLPHTHFRVDESYEDLKKLLELRTAKYLYYAEEDDLK